MVNHIVQRKQGEEAMAAGRGRARKDGGGAVFGAHDRRERVRKGEGTRRGGVGEDQARAGNAF